MPSAGTHKAAPEAITAGSDTAIRSIAGNLLATGFGATSIDGSSHLNGACLLDASVTLLSGSGLTVQLLGWAKARAGAEALDSELGTYANTIAIQGEGYAIVEYASRC